MRHKSPERIQFEHEHLEANGMPGVRLDESSFSFRSAMTYDHLTYCESCDRVVRESQMMGDVCEQCSYSKEVIDKTTLKSATQGDTGPDEVKATAKCLEGPVPTQLKLEL